MITDCVTRRTTGRGSDTFFKTQFVPDWQIALKVIRT